MNEGSAADLGPLLDLMFDDEWVGRCLLDAGGRVLRASRSWLAASGLAGEPILGRDLLALLPAEQRPAQGALHARARAGEVVEATGGPDAGGTWWAERIEPVQLQGGTGLLLSRRAAAAPWSPQASARATAPGSLEALRESEERFRLLAHAMPQIVCVLGPDGAAEYVNQSWIDYSGLDLPATARAGWVSVVHPEDLPAARDCRSKVLKLRSPRDVELRYRRADGTYRWFLSRLAPIVDGARVVRLVGAAMDIEDRKRAEDALRLEDRRKSEFLAVLSHELRNPLAPIRNGLDLLARAPVGSAPAARALEVLHRQVGHLTRLVDDLLDVTRISKGKIELRRAALDLRAVALRTADDLRAIFDAGTVALRVEAGAEPVWVEGDATRLAQVLGNLLQNAFQFTPAGGEVEVALSGAGVARLTVRDSGAGVDPGELERLFEPFAQGAQDMARTRGGLGLGLALVRGLVQLHGGVVRATSAGRGRGAEFTVELPLAAAPEAAAPREAGLSPEAAPAPPGRLVLVIEDNLDAGRSLADALAFAGYRVQVARDARSGLALARAMVPDVAVCDIGLPDVDGYELARQLRREPALARTRLVALTGYAQAEDREQARAAGFDDHLAKPASLERLTALLAAPRGQAGA